jgi:hypothetical protein
MPHIADYFQSETALKSGWSCTLPSDKLQHSDTFIVKVSNTLGATNVILADYASNLFDGEAK